MQERTVDETSRHSRRVLHCGVFNGMRRQPLRAGDARDCAARRCVTPQSGWQLGIRAALQFQRHAGRREPACGLDRRQRNALRHDPERFGKLLLGELRQQRLLLGMRHRLLDQHFRIGTRRLQLQRQLQRRRRRLVAIRRPDGTGRRALRHDRRRRRARRADPPAGRRRRRARAAGGLRGRVPSLRPAYRVGKKSCTASAAAPTEKIRRLRSSR